MGSGLQSGGDGEESQDYGDGEEDWGMPPLERTVSHLIFYCVSTTEDASEESLFPGFGGG